MDYNEAIEWLYSQLPQFQRVGAAAYKPGLDRVIKLENAFGNPHERFPSIHVGGTNGKGSTAHTLAAVLQSAGYKVGLYTSPHLVDFRERIRVDGAMIPRGSVVDFVERYRSMDVAGLSPSFFELTMVMAFEYFSKEEVDIAVVEVGMGGRLDSTNILSPRLSVITNISKDHTAFLGDSDEAIAREKAGIIKPGTPVVVGESSGTVREVFTSRAGECGAPIVYADSWRPFASYEALSDGGILYRSTPWGDLRGELDGDYQPRNAATVMTALQILASQGWRIDGRAVAEGMGHVGELTGLSGRWMKIGDHPTTICDTGHNVGGWQYLAPRLDSYGDRLTMVIGFVNDKDISTILSMMPRRARYIFTQADLPRALDAETLCAEAMRHGLVGQAVTPVNEAVSVARQTTAADGVVFVGGSTFVVGEAISALR